MTDDDDDDDDDDEEEEEDEKVCGVLAQLDEESAHASLLTDCACSRSTVRSLWCRSNCLWPSEAPGHLRSKAILSCQGFLEAAMSSLTTRAQRVVKTTSTRV